MTTPLARLPHRATFWASASVLALCLWSSAAPSVLYPSYSAQWHLTPTILTTIFATYPVALLIALLVFGSISDTIGRRRSMLIGIALILVSALLFVVAPDVVWLYAGRALQGVGAAFSIGAASASLVENNVSKNPRVASSLTTASTALGLALALIVSGALAQYAPLPLELSFWVLTAISAVVFCAVWRTPSDVPDARTKWRPQSIHVAKGLRRVFLVSALSVSLAYSVGALTLSLGATIARQLTGTTDLLVIGALLAVSAVMIGATAIVLQRIHAHVAVMVGAAVSVAGLGLLELCARSGSVGLFLLWCVVGGIGYSLAFMGGLALINRTTAPEHRGATLSAMYLFAYLLQAVTAVGAGVLATGLTLNVAVDIVGPIVAALGLATLVFAAVDWRLRTRAEALLA